jgi:hypothetical protein
MTAALPRLRRAAYFLIAPAVCLALFWRAPFIWFLKDDFAWLGLPLEVHNAADLLRVLFQPMAQGTVRVFSERIYFLVLASLFDVDALPFRIAALATWFANLTLAALIGGRITRSRSAGLIGAILWTCHAALVTPLTWASAYNELLCALCVLTAFYARLRWLDEGMRKWRVIEWTAFLIGFGVLEIIVMYPFVAALHALCFARKRFASTLPLFVPAVLFSLAHVLLIPKTDSPIYTIAIDHRIPATLLHYWNWTVAPGLLGSPEHFWTTLARISAPAVTVALLAFAAWRAWKRDFIPLFFVGWFVAYLGPVLPLPDHLSDYYLTLPPLGLAWLAAWGIVRGWRVAGPPGLAARAAAVALVAAYLVGSQHQIREHLTWVDDRSNRLRVLVEGVDASAQDHRGAAFLLTGVDNDVFQAGFQGDPFRLYGIKNVYLAPGEERSLVARQDLGGVERFIITPKNALAQIDAGKMRVLRASADHLIDFTRAYSATLRAQVDQDKARLDYVNVGDPGYASQLGSTWHNADNSTRWMPKSATVKLSGIDPAARKIYVTGYVPPVVLASGPVTMRLLGNGIEIASVALNAADPFSLEFPLPAALLGVSGIQVTVELNKVVKVPGDPRDLGMIFGTFSIR